MRFICRSNTQNTCLTEHTTGQLTLHEWVEMLRANTRIALGAFKPKELLKEVDTR